MKINKKIAAVALVDSNAPEQTENTSTDTEQQTDATEQRTLAVYALDSSKAYVNGQYIDTEIPYMYKGVTMMPFETIEIGRASCREECRSRWSPYH